jgi:hypothetical protein
MKKICDLRCLSCTHSECLREKRQKETYKRYYESHKAHRIAYQRAYNESHKEQRSEYEKLRWQRTKELRKKDEALR